MYDVDLEDELIESEKYDGKGRQKKLVGYGGGVGVIEELIVGIENRDGKRKVGFDEKERVKRLFERFEEKGVRMNGLRGDCG